MLVSPPIHLPFHTPTHTGFKTLDCTSSFLQQPGMLPVSTVPAHSRRHIRIPKISWLLTSWRHPDETRKDMAIESVPELMTRITGQTTEVGRQGSGSQFSKGLSSFCTSCGQRHWEFCCQLSFQWCLYNKELWNVEIASPSRAEGRSVCWPVLPFSRANLGRFADSSFERLEFLKLGIPECAGVTWPSLHCHMGTGIQGTKAEDDILSMATVVSYKLSFETRMSHFLPACTNYSRLTCQISGRIKFQILHSSSCKVGIQSWELGWMQNCYWKSKLWNNLWTYVTSCYFHDLLRHRKKPQPQTGGHCWGLVWEAKKEWEKTRDCQTEVKTPSILVVVHSFH